MKQQDEEEKATCVLPVQCSAEAYNLLEAIYTGLLMFQLQPHTDSSNTSITLELHAPLSTPDLGTHAYMHVSCVKSYFASFEPKYLQFFILACVLRFMMTKFVITESSN